jgi:hypothetical protein
MMKLREMRLTGHVMREKRNAYRFLVRTPQETTRRPRCTWEDDSKMDVR